MTASNGWRNSIVRLGLWFGLVTGFGEVTLLGLRRYVLHRFLFLGQDSAWMVPVADGLCFLVVGLLLALGHRLWPTRVTGRGSRRSTGRTLDLCLLLMYGPFAPGGLDTHRGRRGISGLAIAGPAVRPFLAMWATFPCSVVLLV
jgi:hypothetical protein